MGICQNETSSFTENASVTYDNKNGEQQYKQNLFPSQKEKQFHHSSDRSPRAEPPRFPPQHFSFVSAFSPKHTTEHALENLLKTIVAPRGAWKMNYQQSPTGHIPYLSFILILVYGIFFENCMTVAILLYSLT